MAADPHAELQGCRVMVVEDEPLEALDYCDRLADAGAEIIGPYGSVLEALDVVEHEALDVALLDHALVDANSDVLQTALEERAIPFVVLTGYPRVLVRRDDRQVVLSKPVSGELLCMTLSAAARTASHPGPHRR